LQKPGSGLASSAATRSFAIQVSPVARSRLYQRSALAHFFAGCSPSLCSSRDFASLAQGWPARYRSPVKRASSGAKAAELPKPN